MSWPLRISSEPPVTMPGRWRISPWTLVTMSGQWRISPVTPVTMSRGTWVSSITPVTMSRQSFGPEFCVVWPPKMPASEWRPPSESSSFVPWFSTFVFRNVPGTVPECVCNCWFKRNSSNLDRAHKMRDSDLLNSWESFSLTLPSISSESCVIYSSLILGTDVFRDWPFLRVSSCVSLVTAANFRLFLNIAIFWREKATQLWRLN